MKTSPTSCGASESRRLSGWWQVVVVVVLLILLACISLVSLAFLLLLWLWLSLFEHSKDKEDRLGCGRPADGDN